MLRKITIAIKINKSYLSISIRYDMSEESKNMSEDQIQAKFFQRCWTELRETRRCLFAVPNGSTRDIREATKLKATGLIAGEPDMILIHQGKAFGFEFKTQTGVVSSSQRTVHTAWAEQNTSVYVLRCPDTAFQIVQAICNNRSLDAFDKYLSVQPVSIAC